MVHSIEQKIITALSTLIEPKLKWNIISLNLLKFIAIENNELSLEIHLISNESSDHNAFRQECLAVLKPFEFKDIYLKLKSVNIATEGISGIKKIVLVGSGKGGVGKSTIAANLAVALAQEGEQVGLMDADIYGPSIPLMMGIDEKPEVLPDEYLLPIERHRVKVMSIGLLVPQGKSIPWRGQMISGTLIQFIQKTLWGDLDTLVIDLPPGTGDIQLTLAHKIRAQGIVIVTTPQEVALGDVRRTVDQYLDLKIPILAIIENMSGLICENCGHENHPFVKSQAGLQVDAACHFQIPLHGEISRTCDLGTPLAIQNPDHPASKTFQQITRVLVSKQLS